MRHNPFRAEFSTYWDAKNIDIVAMQKAVELLPKYSDYRNFCLSPDKHKSTLCQVTAASLEYNNDALVFRISANRFLRAMIRKIVWSLQEIGERKMMIQEFELYLNSKDSNVILKSAFPQGLYLSEVKYPFELGELKSSYPF